MFHYKIYQITNNRKPKVLRKTRIHGAPGPDKKFVNEGDVVDILESEDDEGIITIVTEHGVQGGVLKDNLGSQK